jgi:hypothetical protein
MTDGFRIEDLFEPLDEPTEPSTTPASLDEVVDRFGFDDVYGALLGLIEDEEHR